jgi:hypothetical protein
MRTHALVNVSKKLLFSLVLAAIFLAGGSCRSRTDRTGGPVVLTFGNITGFPSVVSVSTAVNPTTPGTAPGVYITSFALASVVKDPNATVTPAIENVEVTSYQVIYKRKDTGTRVPPPLVAGLSLEVPVNGTGIIGGLALVRLDQLLSPPLSDLANFGKDTETGTAVIVCDAQITFFGHTLSGDAVASGTGVFTLEFTP